MQTKKKIMATENFDCDLGLVGAEKSANNSELYGFLCVATVIQRKISSRLLKVIKIL